MDHPNVEPAEFGIRAVGRLIDYGPALLISVLTALTLGFFAGFMTPQSENPIAVDAITKESTLTYLGAFLATTVYHAFSESIGGASLGKRLLGLEVLSEDLSPATFRQAFRRNLGFFVDALFFGLVAYSAMDHSATRQRVGDRWGKTRVVRRRSLPPELRRPTRIFVFVFLGAIGIAVETVTAAHLLSYWLRVGV